MNGHFTLYCKVLAQASQSLLDDSMDQPIYLFTQKIFIVMVTMSIARMLQDLQNNNNQHLQIACCVPDFILSALHTITYLKCLTTFFKGVIILSSTDEETTFDEAKEIR